MDLLAIAVLVLSTSASMLLVPDVHARDLIEPTVQAALGTPIVLTALLLGRFAGWRPLVERSLLAAFLFFMPTVYLGALALHGGGAPWPAVEAGGQAVFAALALVGLFGPEWVLVGGIAAHGLLWDLWHYGRTPFMPDWYAVGCLVVDVGWAVYAASRVPVWAEERRRRAQAAPIQRAIA
jgi:hypothetical protein